MPDKLMLRPQSTHKKYTLSEFLKFGLNLGRKFTYSVHKGPIKGK